MSWEGQQAGWLTLQTFELLSRVMQIVACTRKGVASQFGTAYVSLCERVPKVKSRRRVFPFPLCQIAIPCLGRVQLHALLLHRGGGLKAEFNIFSRTVISTRTRFLLLALGIISPVHRTQTYRFFR